uniref:Uncharacterized protein n=1 Tax=Rhizophora mucronata TaxID=61149 RepID=A0A2P2IT18_RHIMU
MKKKFKFIPYPFNLGKPLTLGYPDCIPDSILFNWIPQQGGFGSAPPPRKGVGPARG